MKHSGKWAAFPRTAAVDLLFALLLLACAVLVLLIHLSPGMTPCAPSVNPFYIVAPELVAEEAIPDYAGTCRSISFTLEEKSPLYRGGRIYVYLRHTRAEVFLDGEAYYDGSEREDAHIGRTPGNYWLSVPVRFDYVGKTLTIRLTPVYEDFRKEPPPTIFWVDRDTLLNRMVLPDNALPLALSIVAIAAGTFLALFSLSLPVRPEDRRRMVCLAAVTVFAGIWKLCGLPAVLLMLDYTGLHREIWYAGAASYLLTLLLSLRLMNAMRADRNHRIGTVCVCVGIAGALALLLLQIAGLAELHNALVGYGVGMTVLHLVALLGQKPSHKELLWLLPFFLTLGADLLLYFHTGSMYGAPVFLIWILLNLFIRGFGFAREALQRERLLLHREEELRDARVRSLMNQIRPHFIHNILNSIYMLCWEDPERATTVIKEFTAYLHGNFTAISSKKLILFHDELEHTKAYYALESIVYEGKLNVEFKTDYTDFRVPPMTLQPIVENAIKHGVGKGLEKEQIMIRSAAVSQGAEIVVEDNGMGYDPSPDSEAHIGLQNVRERLEMLCGGTLAIEPGTGGGTLVRLWIPQQSEAK